MLHGVAKKDNTSLWIAGGLAAIGLIAMASSSRAPTRQTFVDRLRDALLQHGFRLVAAEFGRLRGEPLWVVTCELPDGRVLRVQVPVAGSPYDRPDQVAEDVSRMLAAA